MAQVLGHRLGKPLTAAAMRQTIHRAREKFADLLIDEVARSLQTGDVERLEQELIDLGLFVLSGFLITVLLIEEHEKKGTISLRNFYKRRFLLGRVGGQHLAALRAMGRGHLILLQSGRFFCNDRNHPVDFAISLFQLLTSLIPSRAVQAVNVSLGIDLHAGKNLRPQHEQVGIIRDRAGHTQAIHLWSAARRQQFQPVGPEHQRIADAAVLEDRADRLAGGGIPEACLTIRRWNGVAAGWRPRVSASQKRVSPPAAICLLSSVFCSLSPVFCPWSSALSHCSLPTANRMLAGLRSR
jgi:hypothetical protein